MFAKKHASSINATTTTETDTAVAGPDVATGSNQDPDGLVVIGKSTHVSGKIGACRVLDVYGILEADVVTEMLIVREGGGIKGTITTHDARILGVVDGTLTVVEHLDIEATGQVVGTVAYKTLSIAKGARFLGKLDIHGATPPAPQPLALATEVDLEATTKARPLTNGVANGAVNGFYPSTH
jgi:cytoskeletal protein CcmA (bactofilin family)